jgi:hypothetical protein
MPVKGSGITPQEAVILASLAVEWSGRNELSKMLAIPKMTVTDAQVKLVQRGLMTEDKEVCIPDAQHIKFFEERKKTPTKTGWVHVNVQRLVARNYSQDHIEQAIKLGLYDVPTDTLEAKLDELDKVHAKKGYAPTTAYLLLNWLRQTQKRRVKVKVPPPAPPASRPGDRGEIEDEYRRRIEDQGRARAAQERLAKKEKELAEKEQQLAQREKALKQGEDRLGNCEESGSWDGSICSDEEWEKFRGAP